MKIEKIPLTIDEYIAGYPENVREILEKMRKAIRLNRKVISPYWNKCIKYTY